MKTLMLVRCPPRWSKLLCENPAFQTRHQQHWGKIITLHQLPAHLFTADAKYQDAVVPGDDDKVRDFVARIIDEENVGLAVVSQKDFWYSRCVEEVCANKRVDLIWTEAFFDNKALFDRVGLPYCPRCEVDDYTRSHIMHGPADLPGSTREAQPEQVAPEDLLAKLNATGEEVVVFGQMPEDMALFHCRGVDYKRWLRELFERNPEARFLFKHHPLAAREFWTDLQQDNVRVVEENVQSLLRAFRRFASFSSTTIFEGAVEGRTFVTGGYHLMRGFSFEAHTPGKLGRLDQYKLFRAPSMDTRIHFICNAYALRLDGPQIVQRFAETSETFFAERLWRGTESSLMGSIGGR